MTQFQKFGAQNNRPRFGQVTQKQPEPPHVTQRAAEKPSKNQHDQRALFEKFSGEVKQEEAKKQEIAARLGGLGWSFLTACICAFLASQILIAPHTLFTHGMAGIEEKLYANAADTLLMGRYILLLGLSAKILSGIGHTIEVEPRSIYMLNGLILGLIMAGGDWVRGEPIQMLSYCLSLSGAFGGYMFWRLRGSPRRGG